MIGGVNGAGTSEGGLEITGTGAPVGAGAGEINDGTIEGTVGSETGVGAGLVVSGKLDGDAVGAEWKNVKAVRKTACCFVDESDSSKLTRWKKCQN